MSAVRLTLCSPVSESPLSLEDFRHETRRFVCRLYAAGLCTSSKWNIEDMPYGGFSCHLVLTPSFTIDMKLCAFLKDIWVGGLGVHRSPFDSSASFVPAVSKDHWLSYLQDDGLFLGRG